MLSSLPHDKYIRFVCYCDKYTNHFCLLKEICLVFSLERNIQESMQKLGTLLAKVKGPQVKGNQVVAEADMILEPLMDLLDGSLTQYAQQCEKTVLKKLLKVRFHRMRHLMRVMTP